MAWWWPKHRNFDYKITLTREKAEGHLAGRIDVAVSSRQLSRTTEAG